MRSWAILARLEWLFWLLALAVLVFAGLAGLVIVAVLPFWMIHCAP